MLAIPSSGTGTMEVSFNSEQQSTGCRDLAFFTAKIGTFDSDVKERI